MLEYQNLLQKVLSEGVYSSDRTGTGTLEVFGHQSRYDLRNGFPLVTTKKVNFKAVVQELLWFLSGSTNVRDLHPCKIWDEWADPTTGELGPIYSHQWRSWGADPAQGTSGIDQISQVIHAIRNNPASRRLIVSAWNVEDIPDMALPPCHVLFQFHVSENRYLDLQLYQRSADLALGVPFNIASYALLQSMVAQDTHLIPRYFFHTLGNAHIYLNHIPGIREQLKRIPRSLPTLRLDSRGTLHHTLDSIHLDGYDPCPAIAFQVSI